MRFRQVEIDRMVSVDVDAGMSTALVTAARGGSMVMWRVVDGDRCGREKVALQASVNGS